MGAFKFYGRRLIKWLIVTIMVKVHLVLAPTVQEKESKGVNRDRQRAPIKIGVLKILKIQKIKSIRRKKGGKLIV